MSGMCNTLCMIPITPINPDTPITPLPPESEVLEAAAQYDFQARSSREVSFRKGDTILLYAQVRVRG